MVLTTAQRGFAQHAGAGCHHAAHRHYINTPTTPPALWYGACCARWHSWRWHDLFIISDENYETLVFSDVR